tara:strand:- start:6758 stop:7591 length:834 start_codon:yes stop_codon:yes gene_type:complete
MASVKESLNTRSLSVGDGAASLRKSYVFEGYANERAVLNTFGTVVVNPDLSTTAVPYVRCRHTQVDTHGWSFLFCHQFELAKQPGTSDLWRCDFDFRSIQPAPLTSNKNSASQGPEEIGFEELSGRCTGGFDLLYRANPAIFDGTGKDGDIGGTPVDVAGQPTSVFRSKYEIALSRTSYQQFSREISDYGSQVGTRTSREIFGIPGGFLLYRGANIVRITHNSYRVSHTWAFDEFAHIIQTPEYTADGNCPLDENGKVLTVFGVQPFPEGGSHSFAK